MRFPKLYAVERQDTGSVIKGQWQMHQARQQRHMPAVPSETPLSSTIFTFRDGMQTLPDALCARLSDVVHMNSPVQGLAQTSDSCGRSRHNAGSNMSRSALMRSCIRHLSTACQAMGLQDAPEVHTLARVSAHHRCQFWF